MTAAINMQGVSKSYENFELRNIDLVLPQGEIMGLVGANGAGKSTTLRILMGLIQADSGKVEVLGCKLPEAQVMAKRDIGYASEDMRLYRNKNLQWHMNFIASFYPSWDSVYATELARRFDLNTQQILKGFSHGQRVKSLLLLILARRPKLLLLDEPTTGLDPVARSEVLECLAEVLQNEERSVLFSSHNTRDVEQLSDSITFLHRGELIASQDKETFLDQWRRIVCQGPWQDRLTTLPNIVFARNNGSLIELKTSAYDSALLPTLQQMGLSVKSVDPMDLEDIFVSSVRAGDKS